MIAACEKRNVKLAVAHRNRYHPALAQIDKLIASGELGKMLEIRGRGKGDRRGGGEDLWVLGSHILNAINMPDKDVPERKSELDKYKAQPVVLCCATGSSSARIARLLKMEGFEKVFSLAGGITSWRNANLPLTKDTKE